ncbi:MAG: hypothetical protein ACI4OL_01085 [Gemmiger sp.]
MTFHRNNVGKIAKQTAPAAAYLAIAAALLLVCSKSSPLYPLNDWMDANIFYTMGKSMMNGSVLYRDVFDHKGPLLYLMYGLAWLVDRDGFFGVYLLETVCFAGFLFFSMRSVELFTGRLHPAWAALPGACILASRAMAHGGSAEELCLPLLACSLYAALAFLQRPAAESGPMPLRTVLLHGILAGCVLFVKFTMMGFYLAWVILLAAVYLKRRWMRPLVQSCGAFLAGMALAFLPWLVYFGLHHALTDFFTVYFYDNLFLYAGSSAPAGASQLYAIAQKFWWGCYDSPLLAALVFGGGDTVAVPETASASAGSSRARCGIGDQLLCPGNVSCVLFYDLCGVCAAGAGGRGTGCPVPRGRPGAAVGRTGGDRGGAGFLRALRAEPLAAAAAAVGTSTMAVC